MHMHMHMHTYTYMHVQVHIYTHMHMHVHVHVQLESPPLQSRGGIAVPASTAISVQATQGPPPPPPCRAQDSATWPRPSGHLFPTVGTPQTAGLV